MDFNFTKEDLKVIEKLIDCDDLKDGTRNDISEFINNYKFMIKFDNTVGEYIKLVRVRREERAVLFFRVEEIEKRKKSICLCSKQVIEYHYSTKSDILEYSSVFTCNSNRESELYCRVECLEEDKIEESIIITRSDFDEELINAVNIYIY